MQTSKLSAPDEPHNHTLILTLHTWRQTTRQRLSSSAHNVTAFPPSLASTHIIDRDHVVSRVIRDTQGQQSINTCSPNSEPARNSQNNQTDWNVVTE